MCTGVYGGQRISDLELKVQVDPNNYIMNHLMWVMNLKSGPKEKQVLLTIALAPVYSCVPVF